jgi:hypothetical protein
MLVAELQQHFMSDEAHNNNFIGVLVADQVKKMLQHS